MLPKRLFLALAKQMFLFGLLAFLALALHATPCLAGASDLDPTFGDGGRVFTDIERIGSVGAGAMVLQADGKLVVCTPHSITLFRFNTDGTLDNSFGDGGVMLSSVSDKDVTVGDIALQPDGKILVGGKKRNFSGYFCDPSGSCGDVYTNDFHLARFNPDGTRDTTFGIDGEVTTDFSHLLGPFYYESEEIRTINVQEDGKIVAVGFHIFAVSEYDDEFNLALVRYNTDGSLDTTFGTGGIALHDLGLYPQDKVLQPDGKIVVLGNFMARFNTDGTIDNTFGTDGIVTSFGNVISKYAVALQTDGKFVVAGYGSSYPPSRCGFGLIRLNPDGSPDTSFGTGEGIITDFGCGEGGDPVRIYADAYAVAVQPDDKIVAMGELSTWTFIEPRQKFYDFVLVRYNPDGSLDTTFGSGGTVVTEFESREAFALDMALQEDGEIIAVGDVYTYPFDPNYGPRRNLALVRHNTDGTLDNGFGTNGTVIQHIVGPSANEALDIMAYQGDGKFLVGGKSYQEHTKWDFAITRHNADGSLDTTFGERGWVTTDFSFEHEQPCERLSASDDWVEAIAVQPDGKILAVGISVSGYYGWCVDGIRALAMARYLSDGSLDATFGNEGKVLIYEAVSANDIALQPDGKIVAVGNTGAYFTVFRFNHDGSPDLGFGSGGRAIIDPFDLPSFVYTESLFSIALQPDGKILAAGAFNIVWPLGHEDLNRWTLFRFNPNGSLDTAFGNGGVAIFFNHHVDGANDLVLQPDGKIVVTGRSRTGHISPTGEDFTLVRYSSDGSFDPTFGSEGVVFTDFGLTPPVWIPNEVSRSVALQPDGRIVLAGVVLEGYEDPDGNLVDNQNFGLVRYNPDGSLDYTFGNGGKVTTEFGSRYEGAEAVTIQADGKILVVGSSSQNFTGKSMEFAIARYEGLGNVVIDGCDSGVLDQVYNEKFISQWIRDCETEAENLGEFVSCVAHLTNDLKKVGPISNSEKGAIQSCAGHANIPQ